MAEASAHKARVKPASPRNLREAAEPERHRLPAEWRPTLLVVDDEQANVLFLERLLRRSGYRDVKSTTDPYEVEEMLAEVEPDLILLDLHMPGLDGHQVMHRLSHIIPESTYLPILVLTADAAPATKQRALVGGAKDFLTKPLDAPEVLARVANLLETRRLHLQLKEHNVQLEDKVRERTADLWATISQLELAQNDLRLAQEETITSLSLAAEFRDDETFRHIERMSRYCSLIGASMGLDGGRRETLRIAAKMHDVGKIGIADAILRKPGKLTPQEFEAMKAHTEIGHDILSGATSELAQMAATIAWTHHERLDGSGYPRGLAGDDIPIEGRIAAVADVFDALTTHRVYRKAFVLPKALAIMREGRGSHFDPDILDVFFDAIDEVLELKERLDETSVAAG